MNPATFWMIIIVAAIALSGCATPQSGAKDMVEYLMDAECKVQSVSVSKNRYKLTTDC